MLVVAEFGQSYNGCTQAAKTRRAAFLRGEEMRLASQVESVSGDSCQQAATMAALWQLSGGEGAALRRSEQDLLTSCLSLAGRLCSVWPKEQRVPKSNTDKLRESRLVACQCVSPTRTHRHTDRQTGEREGDTIGVLPFRLGAALRHAICAGKSAAWEHCCCQTLAALKRVWQDARLGEEGRAFGSIWQHLPVFASVCSRRACRRLSAGRAEGGLG